MVSRRLVRLIPCAALLVLTGTVTATPAAPSCKAISLACGFTNTNQSALNRHVRSIQVTREILRFENSSMRSAATPSSAHRLRSSIEDFNSFIVSDCF